MQQSFLTEMLYNKEINFERAIPETISEAQLREMIAREPQGTLVLTADLAETGRLYGALANGAADVFIGEVPDDPRAFNALCAYPPRNLPAGYRRVVLAGIPDCGALPAGAKAYRLAARAPWLGALPDVDQMREAYKALRRLAARPIRCTSLEMLAHLLSSATGLDSVCCAASALALADMKLIELALCGQPMCFRLNAAQKTDPDSSAVWAPCKRGGRTRPEPEAGGEPMSDDAKLNAYIGVDELIEKIRNTIRTTTWSSFAAPMPLRSTRMRTSSASQATRTSAIPVRWRSYSPI